MQNDNGNDNGNGRKKSINENGEPRIKHSEVFEERIEPQVKYTSVYEKDDSKGTGSSNKKTAIQKFVLTVCAVICSFLIISGGIILAYSIMIKPSNAETVELGQKIDLMGENEQEEQTNNKGENENLPFGGLFSAPKNTSALILGVDESGTLSDVIMVAFFDAATGKIDIISIPRDTYVTLDNDDYQFLVDKGRKIPKNMKINEVHGYAGKELANEFSQRMVEHILQIKIDYFAEVNLEAFRYIVDAVGGVDMEIRAKGFQYKDPDQNLVIDVPGGMVHLDGKLAEGVVRYRYDYARGDLDRIPVQQEFMKQFFKQVLNKDSIIGNLPSFYTMFDKYIKTNFTVDKLLLYVDSVKKLSPDNINFQVLPGEPYEKTFSNGGHGSYYRYFPVEIMGLIDEIFNAKTAEPTQNPTNEVTPTEEVDANINNETIKTEAPTETMKPIVNLKNLNIQILNGGDISGKAADTRDLLRKDGYKIKNVGNFAGTQKKETRIMTRTELNCDELLNYFEDAIVDIDSNIKSDYDIVIIIGTGEK